MSRKMVVYVKVRLIVDACDYVQISDVINEMDYNFSSDNSPAYDIEDAEIMDYEVIDSK